MKYLLLIAILALAYMVWREGRVREAGDRQPEPRRTPPAPPALPLEMVRCPVCSVHLPKGEAFAGASGRLYCTHEHRVRGGN